MINLLFGILIISLLLFVATFRLSMKVRLVITMLFFLCTAVMFYIVIYNANDTAMPGSKVITQEMLNSNGSDTLLNGF